MKVGRCDRCKRDVYDRLPDFPARLTPRMVVVAPDFGGSHFFCEGCLDAEEIEQAKALGEWAS